MMKYCHKILLKIQLLLVSCIRHQARRNNTVDPHFIQDYTCKIYAAVARKMGVADPKPFTASASCLHGFKQ